MGRPGTFRRLLRRSSELNGVTARLRDARTLLIEVRDGHSRAGAIAEVLRLVENRRLSLHSIRSGLNETEDAYLQLLQEDQAYGFRRFHLQGRPVDDAVAGDL